MQSKTANTKEGIDKRTIRAATESMTTIALGSGEFKVYSGTRKSYVVDLVTETCECPSAEYQSGPCKHLRRTQMEAGLREIPDLGRRTDVEIMVGARVDEEPVAIADGGTIAAPAPQGSTDETTHVDGCDNPECEGIDVDVERPLLSMECWHEWAAYDEEQLIEEARR